VISCRAEAFGRNVARAVRMNLLWHSAPVVLGLSPLRGSLPSACGDSNGGSTKDRSANRDKSDWTTSAANQRLKSKAEGGNSPFTGSQLRGNWVPLRRASDHRRESSRAEEGGVHGEKD